jgi:hypothetical protein
MGLLSSDDEEDIGKRERGGFKTADRITTHAAKRVIDEEAGVVIYAVKFNSDMNPAADGGGYGLTAVPIEDTNLTLDDAADDEE